MNLLQKQKKKNLGKFRDLWTFSTLARVYKFKTRALLINDKRITFITETRREWNFWEKFIFIKREKGQRRGDESFPTGPPSGSEIPALQLLQERMETSPRSGWRQKNKHENTI